MAAKLLHLMTFSLKLIAISPLIIGGGCSVSTNRNPEEIKDFGTLHTMDKLIYWSNKEESINKVLKPRLEDLTVELSLIDKYMADYEESSQKALAPENVIAPANTPEERGKIIGSSAILSHLMITRYTTVIAELRKLLTSEQYIQHQEDVFDELDIERKYYNIYEDGLDFLLEFDNKPKKQKRDPVIFPDWKDLQASYWAFIHTHEVYGFSPEKIYKGLTNDTDNGELTATQCTKIGMFALKNGFYYIAIEWLELAIDILQLSQNTDNYHTVDLVRSLLRNTIKTHNHRWHNYRDVQTVLNTFVNYTYEGQPTHERVRGREYYAQKYGGKAGNASHPHANFLTLCNESNEDFQPSEIKRSLKCYLERNLHPYFILNPVKTEQISEYPLILQMHDVLGNQTINELHDNAASGRGQYVLIGSDSMNLFLAKMKFRTSSSMPLQEDGELNKKINTKSGMLTGLRMLQEEDEMLYATEYTYGRYYIQHSDAFPPGVLKTLDPSLRKAGIGNRLATVLYYIEEPNTGGATPFCEVGAAVKSKRGSAIFWINMFRNGTIRNDVTHGACPVIHGNKIVVNRWIAYDSNFLTFKCSLNQFE